MMVREGGRIGRRRGGEGEREVRREGMKEEVSTMIEQRERLEVARFLRDTRRFARRNGVAETKIRECGRSSESGESEGRGIGRDANRLMGIGPIVRARLDADLIVPSLSRILLLGSKEHTTAFQDEVYAALERQGQAQRRILRDPQTAHLLPSPTSLKELRAEVKRATNIARRCQHSAEADANTWLRRRRLREAADMEARREVSRLILKASLRPILSMAEEVGGLLDAILVAQSTHTDSGNCSDVKEVGDDAEMDIENAAASLGVEGAGDSNQRQQGRSRFRSRGGSSIHSVRSGSSESLRSGYGVLMGRSGLPRGVVGRGEQGNDAINETGDNRLGHGERQGSQPKMKGEEDGESNATDDWDDWLHVLERLELLSMKIERLLPAPSATHCTTSVVVDGLESGKRGERAETEEITSDESGREYEEAYRKAQEEEEHDLQAARFAMLRWIYDARGALLEKSRSQAAKSHQETLRLSMLEELGALWMYQIFCPFSPSGSSTRTSETENDKDKDGCEEQEEDRETRNEGEDHPSSPPSSSSSLSPIPLFRRPTSLSRTDSERLRVRIRSSASVEELLIERTQKAQNRAIRKVLLNKRTTGSSGRSQTGTQDRNAVSNRTMGVFIGDIANETEETGNGELNVETDGPKHRVPHMMRLSTSTRRSLERADRYVSHFIVVALRVGGPLVAEAAVTYLSSTIHHLGTYSQRLSHEENTREKRDVVMGERENDGDSVASVESTNTLFTHLESLSSLSHLQSQAQSHFQSQASSSSASGGTGVFEWESSGTLTPQQLESQQMEMKQRRRRRRLKKRQQLQMQHEREVKSEGERRRSGRESLKDDNGEGGSEKNRAVREREGSQNRSWQSFENLVSGGETKGRGIRYRGVGQLRERGSGGGGYERRRQRAREFSEGGGEKGGSRALPVGTVRVRRLSTFLTDLSNFSLDQFASLWMLSHHRRLHERMRRQRLRWHRSSHSRRHSVQAQGNGQHGTAGASQSQSLAQQGMKSNSKRRLLRRRQQQERLHRQRSQSGSSSYLSGSRSSSASLTVKPIKAISSSGVSLSLKAGNVPLENVLEDTNHIPRGVASAQASSFRKMQIKRTISNPTVPLPYRGGSGGAQSSTIPSSLSSFSSSIRLDKALKSGGGKGVDDSYIASLVRTLPTLLSRVMGFLLREIALRRAILYPDEANANFDVLFGCGKRDERSKGAAQGFQSPVSGGSEERERERVVVLPGWSRYPAVRQAITSSIKEIWILIDGQLRELLRAALYGGDESEGVGGKGTNDVAAYLSHMERSSSDPLPSSRRVQRTGPEGGGNERMSNQGPEGQGHFCSHPSSPHMQTLPSPSISRKVLLALQNNVLRFCQAVDRLDTRFKRAFKGNADGGKGLGSDDGTEDGQENKDVILDTRPLRLILEESVPLYESLELSRTYEKVTSFLKHWRGMVGASSYMEEIRSSSRLAPDPKRLGGAGSPRPTSTSTQIRCKLVRDVVYGVFDVLRNRKQNGGREDRGEGGEAMNEGREAGKDEVKKGRTKE